MPGDGVGAGAVPVEADRAERHAVALIEGGADLVEEGQWDRAVPSGPPGTEAGLGQDAAVHRHLPLAPGDSVHELVEDRVGTGQPHRCVIDPRRLVDPMTRQVGELRIDRRRRVPEQRRLTVHMFEYDGTTARSQPAGAGAGEERMGRV